MGVRAFWALVVFCLVAATGVQPLHAAGAAERPAHAQLVDRRPALPTVTAPQPASLLIAPRPSVAPGPGLPHVVLPAPPAPVGVTANAIATVSRRSEPCGIAWIPTRSARGPPRR